MKTSQQHEKSKTVQEDKLSEAGKKIARLEAENTQFKKSLLKKDRVVEELSRYRSQVEAELKSLIQRLESTEKENSSLKYEIRVLEKELEIRHEEREFDLRTAEAAQKKHVESLEKISRLESECQKLRSLVQKRLLGPTAFARMKNEIEGIGWKDSPERSRRIWSNQRLTGSTDFHGDVAGDGLTKRIDFLSEQLQRMEEENTRLKCTLEGKTIDEREKYSLYAQEKSPASLSELGSDEKASFAGSWAFALINELENFKNEKKMKTYTPDMKLMDDFAEMEKLAHSPAVSGHFSQATEKNSFLNLEACGKGNEDKNCLTAKKSASEFNVSVPLKKIIELLEGINAVPQDDIGKILPSKDLANQMVRVFQCESGEVAAVLRQFVQTCDDLLGGEADIEQFVQLVASNLEWVMSHCFSLQDVMSTNDYGGSGRQSAETSELCIVTEEAKKLNLQPANKELSVQGHEEQQIKKVETLRIQLKDSNVINKHSQSEKPTKRESVDNSSEDQTEEQKIMKQDSQSRTQIVITNLEYRKPCEDISRGENDHENTSKSFKDLEETCYDLKKQLDGERSKEVANDKNQLQNDAEITSASDKLAECQATLRNLGKQLKALASPKEADLFEKVVSTPADLVITSMSTPKGNGNQRLSLLDKMLAEDNTVQIGVSPKTEDAIENGHENSAFSNNARSEPGSNFTDLNEIGHDADRNAIVHKAIVPRKKKDSKSFLKKLIWWKKRSNGKKTPFP
ncbi:Filament-like plant protein 7 [Striga hermonthica]|uniref:Filament-like plant protein 7 n=1 Tax=Striga hermonthica TaxID=68872 RepID=A0A9N7NPB0_STRHE|nr:Filament-like plant protein 7 [Striga hermonthica]